MPSITYCGRGTLRTRALGEIAKARGRRYATQQINRAFTVLLASHSQGYCRNLYLECVEHLRARVPTAE